MMDWALLEWEKHNREILDIRVSGQYTTIEGLPVRRNSIGIDPGRNFGMAIVHTTGKIEMYNGYLHKDKDWSYARDGLMAHDLMIHLGNRFSYPSISYPSQWGFIIEGSAFSKSKGEANLAYIREGFFLGAIRAGFQPRIVPPNKIRKAVTGHGRTRMFELLPTVNENKAAALAAALYGAGYEVTLPE